MLSTHRINRADYRLAFDAETGGEEAKGELHARRSIRNPPARVRHRFAATLESKITEAVVSADHMSRSSDGVIKHVCESYRHLHGICGIGPTVGFTATGEAARAAEVALMQAYRESRGLTH
jgi:hypothetical protein